MKKIIFILISIWLTTCFIATREYRELKRSSMHKINSLYKENVFSIYREAIINLNTPKISKVTQVSTAAIYFCKIAKKDKYLFYELNNNNPICTNWTKKTKKMYKNYFLNIISIDTSDESNCTLKGLEIVNKMCLQ